MARDDRRQRAEDRAPAPDLHGLAGPGLRPDGSAQEVATWTLTIRAGARVERERFETLERALAELEDRIEELAQAARRDPAQVKLRRYTPEEQVLARVELAGPERRWARTRAGVDVHGDGSTEAYLGRVRRQALDREGGETAVATLRRALRER